LRRVSVEMRVSVLFNEPKLLKSLAGRWSNCMLMSFSALQRAEIAEMAWSAIVLPPLTNSFSALQRAEIAEILSIVHTKPRIAQFQCSSTSRNCWNVDSLLRTFGAISFQCSSTSRNCWNLKSFAEQKALTPGFSALQRAEIAEISIMSYWLPDPKRFSALQRAEIAEI